MTQQRDEELVHDDRAGLKPSEQVEQKLEERLNGKRPRKTKTKTRYHVPAPTAPYEVPVPKATYPVPPPEETYKVPAP